MIERQRLQAAPLDGYVWFNCPTVNKYDISPVTMAGVLVLLSAFRGWPPVAWPALLSKEIKASANTK